ncbi:MAG: hypothetical protein HY290_17905 [Planctomycetia bacterium]|nr:hypothetical protein [Planctomycetia bacterium]
MRVQRPVQKIILPKRIKALGHDPLMTPLRLPYGVSPSPFATKDIHFGKGARLDVKSE